MLMSLYTFEGIYAKSIDRKKYDVLSAFSLTFLTPSQRHTVYDIMSEPADGYRDKIRIIDKVIDNLKLDCENLVVRDDFLVAKKKASKKNKTLKSHYRKQKLVSVGEIAARLYD